MTRLDPLVIAGILLLLSAGSSSAAQDSKPASRAASRPAPVVLSPEVKAAETRLTAALKEKDASKRRQRLEETLSITNPLRSSMSDIVALWRIRAAAAVELDSWQDGREAGMNLKRLLPPKGGDSAARKALDSVTTRGWLDPDVRTVEAAARSRAEAAARERLRTWATLVKGAALDQATGLPKEVVHTQTGIVMVLVPAGSFVCGASPNDPSAFENELPSHRVTVSRPFYLGKFEVTNAQYLKGDRYHESPMLDGATFDGLDQPAIAIAWAQAKAFCDQFGLRLPSEAEWEYAARAGTTTRYPWGDDPERGEGSANVLNQSRKVDRDGRKTGVTWDDGFLGTAPVGKFKANAFGIHEMVGNVWEWVDDWFDSGAYAARTAGATDPCNLDVKTAEDEPEIDLDTPGQQYRPPFRILRGGAFSTEPWGFRLSFRQSIAPHHAMNDTGFRVAKTP